MVSQILIIVAFVIGFFLGKEKFIVYREKKTKIKENKEEKIKERKREEVIQAMLDNIDAYDGTGKGQKDIPYSDEEDDLWT